MNYQLGDSPVPEEALNGSEKKGGDMPVVPEEELEITFARSSGPGGQNVNKRSTKAVLHWDVLDSNVFTDKQKEKILTAAGLDEGKSTAIVLHEDGERSQLRNKKNVIKRLQELVTEALKPVKKRLPTKPSRAAKKRNVKEQIKHKKKKQDRRPPKDGWQ